MITPEVVGTEWLIEVGGCNPASLRDASVFKALFETVIEDLGLKTVGQPIWHKFSGEGGITGLVALSESHLACHTYPEFGTATINLYCCRSRPEWDWENELKTRVEARNVRITKFLRGNPEKSVAAKGGNA